MQHSFGKFRNVNSIKRDRQLRCLSACHKTRAAERRSITASLDLKQRSLIKTDEMFHFFLLKVDRNDERVARKIMTFSGRTSQLKKELNILS